MVNHPSVTEAAGKRINIYMNREVHAAATKRAFELNISFSRYLELLITRSQQRSKKA